jgi:acyl-CoA dehydrogenase
MAIDFTLTPDLEDIRLRVRGFVDDVDRSIQVHGALGYSTDTPLASMCQHAGWARFADGADEVHQMRIAQRTIAAYTDNGSTRTATGDLPL